MGHLVGRQSRPPLAHGSTRQRTLRERRRHVLLERFGEREDDPDTLYLVRDHDNVRPMGAGVVVRRRQNVGNELGDGIPSDLTVYERGASSAVAAIESIAMMAARHQSTSFAASHAATQTMPKLPEN